MRRPRPTSNCAARGHLFAVSEAYPELRSSEQFQQLQHRVSTLEERIADRREFYNESVSIFNARIRELPDVLFARALDLEARELFEAEKDDLRDVDVAERLGVHGEPSVSPRRGVTTEPRSASADEA